MVSNFIGFFDGLAHTGKPPLGPALSPKVLPVARRGSPGNLPRFRWEDHIQLQLSFHHNYPGHHTMNAGVGQMARGDDEVTFGDPTTEIRRGAGLVRLYGRPE